MAPLGAFFFPPLALDFLNETSIIMENPDVCGVFSCLGTFLVPKRPHKPAFMRFCGICLMCGQAISTNHIYMGKRSAIVPIAFVIVFVSLFAHYNGIATADANNHAKSFDGTAFVLPRIAHYTTQLVIGDAVKEQAVVFKPTGTDESKTLVVWATAYSSEPSQTDDTPFITASGSRVRDGVAAANFLPIGTQFRLPEEFGDKIFTVEDRMNPRYNNQHIVDIWFQETHDAHQFGKRMLTLELL